MSAWIPGSITWNGDITAGQVWRASAEGATTVLVVTAVDAGRVDAMPVTFHSSRGTPQSLHVPASVGHFGVPAVIWVSLENNFSWEVLDCILDHWRQPSLLDWLTKPMSVPPPGCAIDVEQVDFFDPVYEEHDDLLEMIDRLRSEETDWPAQQNTESQQEAMRGLKIQDLEAILGVGFSEALSIIRGDMPLTTAQAQILGAALGKHFEAGMAGNVLAPELIAIVSHPLRRQDIDRLGSKWSMGRSEARIHLARATMFGLAARTSRGSADWNSRVQAVIDSEINR
jgi:hypothetical protein